ncbi:hypothetical protein A9975_36715 [Cupriavidus sp. UME77]|nr:hypothetical protein [Cupriavidus sp. UME77]
MRGPARLIDALEIAVLADIWHACQHLGKALAPGRVQRPRKNFTVLGLSATTVCGSLLTQPLY